MRHLLVTNDFPPKIGGIQSYLWELWRRLDPEDVTVLTTACPGDVLFDRAQSFKVVRARQQWFLPTPSLVRQIRSLAGEVDAGLVVLDPCLPLGLVGPHLGLPYAVIGHGAEFVIPSRLPVVRQSLDRVIGRAQLFIASGAYVEERANQLLSRMSTTSKTSETLSRSPVTSETTTVVTIAPGVDAQRFCPLEPFESSAARERFDVAVGAQLVVGVSRLVPRKGFDRLIRAAGILREKYPDLIVLIGGDGRDRKRLDRLVERHRAPVRMLGRVGDADLPALYGCSDIFAMPCHDRWLGLEREGFGIVFLEAAAAGVPQLAGHSGGSAEAVVDGDTGIVVGGKVSATSVAEALDRMLADDGGRLLMAGRGRKRVEAEFTYDLVAAKLSKVLQQAVDAR